MNQPHAVFDITDSVGAWLWPTTRAFKRAMDEELAAHDITHQQFAVLLHTAQSDEVSQADLAQCLGVEPPTVSGLIDRMERDGWIAREPAPGDRRRNVLRLRERAEPVWRQMLACAERVRDRAVRGMSDDELDALRGTLERVRANLEGEQDHV